MSPGRYAIWALAVIVGIAALTCWPILVNPQLEPDDYRYLRLADDVLAGRMPFADAVVVENGWDHLWFPATDAIVRFFRPTVVSSVLVEALLTNGTGGSLLTNVGLHVGSALLVAWLALRLLGPGLPALAATALFAAFAAHGEALWYMSGRNATLAAFGFLAALVLHGGGPRARWIALPCFAFALASKELTIGLPLLCLLHDRWQAGCASIGHALRSRWPLYLGYALVALCWWLLRTAIVGDLGDTPLREPYFVSPASAAFPVHLGVQLWSYGENLLLGAQSPPFLTASELGTFATTTGLIVTILAAATTTWFLRGERRFWFVAALAFCAWLPTSFVYVSERYLYLPSAAVAISAGLLLQRSWRHRMARTMFTLLLVVWGTNQAWTLFAKHRYLAHAPRSAWAVSALMQRLGDRLPRGAKLLFVDFPGDVVHAQFLEDQLRITLDDPDLTCRVLTLAPATTGGPIAMRRLDPHTFEVRSRGSLMTPDRVFPFVPMQPGTTVQRPRSGCAEVTVLDGDGGTLRAARFRLEDPIDDWHVIRFQPPGPRDPFFPGRWILQGRMQIVRP